MTINRFAFAAALRALGNAEVFTGDWKKPGGLVSLGAKEGAITENISWTTNELVASEQTGAIPHQASVVLGGFTFTVPIIAGDPDLWAKIEPHGKSYGVSDNPVDVIETAVLLIPRSEISETVGLSYTAPAGLSTATVWTAKPGNSAGNATIASLVGKAAGIRQKLTITFLTPTTFSVSAQDGTVLGNGTLGTPYVSAVLNFTATAGATPQVAGDVKYIQIESAVGEGWLPAAPINSLFFPRAYVTHGDVSRPFDGGGKSIVSVTFHPMYQSSGPAGKRVYVRGDFVAEGYTGAAI